MANKYIIHGAANNGDGTASNEAASPGAAGAWNDINVFEGTTPAYGSLGAGDVVYIRSKTSAGADITRTLAADVNLGSTAATAINPITWILDNGVTWSGVSGTLKYTSSNTAYEASVRANNIVAALTQDALVFENTVAAPSAGSLLAQISGHVIGALFDWSAKTNTNEATVRMTDGAVLESPHIKYGRLGSSATTITLISVPTNAMASVQVLDPDIELTNSTVGGPLTGSSNGTYSGELLFIGGRIRGAGAVSGQPVFYLPTATSHVARMIRAVGFDIPRAMDIVPSGFTTSAPGSMIEIVGCDDGVGGVLFSLWGSATSRTDNNPPTLSATLPDSESTPWSWRVYPASAEMGKPMRLPTVKMFTGTAATKTITQELLVADTMAPTKKTLWITVDYIDDATGLPKHISTRDFAGGALDSSTANWSATTWGMVTLLKRKIEIATPTAIKPDTLVTVTLWGIEKSATANDIYFVDPDFGVN